MSIIQNFDEHFTKEKLSLEDSFSKMNYQINQNQPTKDFAQSYFIQNEKFIQLAKQLHKKEAHATVR